jgi:hypothetical protein
MRSDGTSEQGLWCNNNLVEEFCIEMQELLTFQAAVQRGEIIATKAEAHANAAAAVGGGKVSKLSWSRIGHLTMMTGRNSTHIRLNISKN